MAPIIPRQAGPRAGERVPQATTHKVSLAKLATDGALCYEAPCRWRQHGLVVVVGLRYLPRFISVQTTGSESTERLLNDRHVHQLWINRDELSVQGLSSLVDRLRYQARRQIRPSIDRIVVFGITQDEPEIQELLQKLQSTRYAVGFIALTPELFIDTQALGLHDPASPESEL